ncbi:MAG: deaminase [Candidatus Pacearchaeota archaeon]
MKYVTDENEKKEIESYVGLAAAEAKNSTCKKSQRGAIIVKDGKILGKGHNKVILEDLCCIRKNIRNNSKVELCAAIHAEQMAIINAVNAGKPLNGSRMYIIKVKDGKIKASGKPSCTVCSKMIYESGIAEVVLLHENGYAIYNSEEFNELSFEYFLKT